ncbi:MAG: 2-dehydro-3-deoxy-6-phosphogalactonate aldolase [Rhodanobacteraceae bacterium]|nr:MAG: 2-dehydro-3-deoxy-6-phosphogalactonate aldolase [Rhodanobacteraceae bacterium]
MQTNWLEPLPLVAILRGLSPDEAVAIGDALITAGFHILEVPLNSPEPLESIRRLSDAFGKDCLVGAGTVMTPDAVAEVAQAGGRLIVTPHTDPAVIVAAKTAGMLCTPGTATPSEAFAALRAGADAIKVFPAEQVTPKVLRAWRAVLPPQTAILPVGGITLQNMAEYLHAGATGFGIGSALYKPGKSVDEVARAAHDFVHRWKFLATARSHA